MNYTGRDIESSYSYDDTCSSEDEKYHSKRKKTHTLLIVGIGALFCGIIGVSVYLIVECTKKGGTTPVPIPTPDPTPGPPGPTPGTTPTAPGPAPGPLVNPRGGVPPPPPPPVVGGTVPPPPPPPSSLPAPPPPVGGPVPPVGGPVPPVGGPVPPPHPVVVGSRPERNTENFIIGLFADRDNNSCFADTALHCLLGIERFYNHFLEEKPRGTELQQRLSSFVEEYSRKGNPQSRSIRDAMTENRAKYASDSVQHDMWEFLSSDLLEDIHKSFNPHVREWVAPPGNPDDLDEAGQLALSDQQFRTESGTDGIVHQLFHIVTKSHVEGSGKLSFNHGRHLDIYITEKTKEGPANVVVDEVNAYFSPEQTDLGKDKQTTLQVLPEVLAIRMVREEYDRVAKQMRKNQLPMIYPETLNIRQEWLSTSSVDYNFPPSYELIEIMDHHGAGGTAAGHWSARIKQFQNKKWVNVNGSRVTKIENPLEDPKGLATIFLYQRIRED